MSDLYKVGSQVEWDGIKGMIIPNVKLPGDIMIAWETQQISSYDEEFLIKSGCKLLGDLKGT
jgi:hypothetical protein